MERFARKSWIYSEGSRYIPVDISISSIYQRGAEVGRPCQVALLFYTPFGWNGHWNDVDGSAASNAYCADSSQWDPPDDPDTATLDEGRAVILHRHFLPR